jgi:hypothetical protein
MRSTTRNTKVNDHYRLQQSRRLIVLLVALLLANLQLGGRLASASRLGAASVVTPDITTATPLPGALQIINASPTNQFDPHVDCNLASYGDDRFGELTVRYFDFTTNTDAAIPVVAGLDFLSEVSGSRIVFTRVTREGSQIGVFDTATGAIATVPGGYQRTNASISGTLVAFEDRGFSANSRESEIVAYDLATGATTRLSNDSLMDLDPMVTPTGDAVVFQKCQTTGFGCDIYVATRTSSGGFTVSPLTGPAGEESNVDTNGTIVVYESTVGGESDIAYQPISGGAETRIALPGAQRNPSIAGHLISFESQTPEGNFDIFVYDTANNRLHRLPQTPVDESLNDITVCGGQARVVFSSPGANGDFDVFAFTFSLPSSAAGQITDLRNLVISFNLPHGIEHSLLVKLDDALAAVNAGDTAGACESLNAFINQARAQRGKKISAAQAAQLINGANQIKQTLGCQ